MSHAEMSESHQNFRICRGTKGYVIQDEEGAPVAYDEAPRPIRLRYDRLELRRQGQLELPFS